MTQAEFTVHAEKAKDTAQLSFRKQRLNLRQYGCILRNIGATVEKHKTEPDKAEKKLQEILHKLTNNE